MAKTSLRRNQVKLGQQVKTKQSIRNSQIPLAKPSIIPINDLNANAKLMASVLGMAVMLAAAIIFICSIRAHPKDQKDKIQTHSSTAIHVK